MFARLQRHPQLYEQMAALLDEVENRAGTLNTADQAEDALVERMRQIGRQAPGRRAEQRHVEVQPARTPGLRQVGKKKLCWLTTFGAIALEEQLRRRGPHTRRPFCTAAGVQPQGSSRRLQRALTDFGADDAFAAAAAKMQEHYGVNVPVGRVRTVTLQHSRVLAAQSPAPVCTLPAHGAERIVGEADGTRVPVVDTSAAPPATDRRKHRKVCYREARLAAACAQGSATTRYGATLHDVADTCLAPGAVRQSGRPGPEHPDPCLGRRRSLDRRAGPRPVRHPGPLHPRSVSRLRLPRSRRP